MAQPINFAQDILDVSEAKATLDQIVAEVERDHNHKVILYNSKPAVVLVNVNDYEELQERLFALEFQLGIREMKEADARGELRDWDEMLAGWGITLAPTPKPKGYDEMIPKKYREQK